MTIEHENKEVIRLFNRTVRFWINEEYNLEGKGRRLDIPITPEESERFMDNGLLVGGGNRDKLVARIAADVEFVVPTVPVNLVLTVHPWRFKEHSGLVAYFKEYEPVEQQQ